VVEVFDFNGAAFELLRDRRARERAAGAGGRCRDGALAEDGAPAHLPPAVPILVRAHGTIQLIDRAEAAAGGGGAGGGRVDPRDALVYRMEQYCLAAADGVLAQSPAMAAYYARAYRLPARQVLLAPPPMARILAPFAAVRAGPAAAAAAVELPQPPLFLVLGKLQRVKGTETVAAALALLHARRPEADFRAEFIGGDAHCTVHQQRTSACVAAALPPALRPRVTLAGEKPRSALPALLADAIARGAVAAVAASSFETFCMAAHEAAAAGLPLIAADIPALSDAALAPLAVARFRSGNASDLARQLERALDAHAAAAAVATARGALPPAYDRHGGPLDVYARARARVADADELLLADQAVGAACDAAAAAAGAL
jgi:glycosyltransferase involved in cell wall biosynthesis